MKDELLANEAIQAGVRKLLEERKLGDFSLNIIHSAPHIMVIDEVLREQPPVLVVVGSQPPVKNPWDGLTNEEIDRAMERLVFKTDGYKTGPFSLPGGHYAGVGKPYTFREAEEERSFRISGLSLLAPDAGLPEWQKRRNASARAKAALVKKLKGRRK